MKFLQCCLSFLVISFAFLPSGSQAQDATVPVVPDVKIPALPKTGANAAAFAPPGWAVKAQLSGDLNGDGKPDLLFLLQDIDKKNILANTYAPDQPTDTNPRVLAVAFANASGSGYTLALENSTLIPRWTDPTIIDVFGGPGALTLARGAFSVQLDSPPAGKGNSTFTFRFQHSRWQLIGFDINEADNENLYTTSVNYLTGRVKQSTGALSSDKTKTTWTTLHKRSLYNIEDVGSGTDFIPDGVNLP